MESYKLFFVLKKIFIIQVNLNIVYNPTEITKAFATVWGSQWWCEPGHHDRAAQFRQGELNCNWWTKDTPAEAVLYCVHFKEQRSFNTDGKVLENMKRRDVAWASSSLQQSFSKTVDPSSSALKKPLIITDVSILSRWTTISGQLKTS